MPRIANPRAFFWSTTPQVWWFPHVQWAPTHPSTPCGPLGLILGQFRPQEPVVFGSVWVQKWSKMKMSKSGPAPSVVLNNALWARLGRKNLRGSLNLGRSCSIVFHGGAEYRTPGNRWNGTPMLLKVSISYGGSPHPSHASRGGGPRPCAARVAASRGENGGGCPRPCVTVRTSDLTVSKTQWARRGKPVTTKTPSKQCKAMVHQGLHPLREEDNQCVARWGLCNVIRGVA